MGRRQGTGFVLVMLLAIPGCFDQARTGEGETLEPTTFAVILVDPPSEVNEGVPFTVEVEVHGASGWHADVVTARFGTVSAVTPSAESYSEQCETTSGSLPGSFEVACSAEWYGSGSGMGGPSGFEDCSTQYIRGQVRVLDQDNNAWDYWSEEEEFCVYIAI